MSQDQATARGGCPQSNQEHGHVDRSIAFPAFYSRYRQFLSYTHLKSQSLKDKLSASCTQKVESVSNIVDDVHDLTPVLPRAFTAARLLNLLSLQRHPIH